MKRIRRWAGGAAAAALAVAGLGGTVPVAAAAHAQTAVIRPAPRALATWRSAIRHVRTPGHGCFNASYPALRWHPVTCGTAPNVAFGPGRSGGTASRLRPDVGRDQGDYVAQIDGNITQATGSFSDVSPNITEEDHYYHTANDFSLQLNSNLDSQSILCQGRSTYDNGCFFWEQFLYSSFGPDGHPEIFIQDWVFDLGEPCKDIGWTDHSPSDGSEFDCMTNSATVQVRQQLTASDLASVTLTGTASANIDTVYLTLGSTAYAASRGDLGLYGTWNQTQWGVYGPPSDGADFSDGSALEAVTALVASTGGAAPDCQYVLDPSGLAGMTGEWNNLLRSTTVTPSAGALPTMASYQTTVSSPWTLTPNCAVQAADFAPSISPAAYSVTHLPAGSSSYSCPSGRLCLQVNDPTTQGTTVFDLYYCRTYALSHWYNDGTYIDNQTGSSTTTYFYGASTSQQLAKFTPTGTQSHTFNWTPVDSIKSC